LKKPRNSNHRDKADRQKAREMANTKNENQQLRRKVARLQREIDRLEFVGSVDVEDDAIVVGWVKPKQKLCRVCGKDSLKEISTPTGKTIITCTQCMARQIV
jgi:hypothetical protein